MGGIVLGDFLGDDLLQAGGLVRVQLDPELLPVIDGGEGLGRQTVGFGSQGLLLSGIGFGLGLAAQLTDLGKHLRPTGLLPVMRAKAQAAIT